MHSTNSNNNNNNINEARSSYVEIYDIPKRATPVNYDLPKAAIRRIPNTGMSILSAQQQQQQQQEEDLSYDVPRSSASSSNRSSLAANFPDYDVPKRNPIPVHRQLLQQQQQQKQHLPIATTIAASTAIAATPPTPAGNLKVLPLNLSSALETLAKLHTESINVITRLLSFVQPNWRQPQQLEPQLMEINLALLRLRTALHGLTEFGEGALANAQGSEDAHLAQKLRPLVLALKNASHLIGEANEAIELQGGWTLKNLARLDAAHTPDSLEQIMACAQALTEDVRQLACFIHGNAQQLFKQPAAPPVSLAESADWLEDYDYVSFESKDAAHKKHTVLREKILPSLKEEFDSALKTAEHYALKETTPTQAQQFVLKDKLLLRYYAGQICTHMCSLRQAIDSFLETVERNQPPKFFIAYGKFVVVSAHNLVTIGDIVHRNICKQDLRDKILNCTNALTDALRSCVNKSTKAAANFPSVIAVQEMVDAVVDISHLASELKTSMLQAVQLTF